jgi:endogenous inhibitor of DNA gyrase (YacG/DUF329 family)
VSETTTQVACPTCGKAVPWTAAAKFRPFCSERCRLLDLGKWADESHRIPGEDAPQSTEDAVPREGHS